LYIFKNFIAYSNSKTILTMKTCVLHMSLRN